MAHMISNLTTHIYLELNNESIIRVSNKHSIGLDSHSNG